MEESVASCYSIGDGRHWVMSSMNAVLEAKQKNERPNDNIFHAINKIAEIVGDQIKDALYFKFQGNKLECGCKRYTKEKSYQDVVNKAIKKINTDVDAKFYKRYKNKKKIPIAFFYNIAIYASVFQSKSFKRMEEAIKIALEMDPSEMFTLCGISQHSNSGIQSEYTFKRIANYIMDYFKNSKKPIYLRIDDMTTGKTLEFNGVEFIHHVGTTKNDVADFRIGLIDGTDRYISFKTLNAQEYNSQTKNILTKRVYEKFFFDAMHLEEVVDVISCSADSNECQDEQKYKVHFKNGYTGIAMKVPNDMVSEMIFGEGHVKCQAIVMHSWVEEDRNKIIFEEGENFCRATIKVSRLILDSKDIADTDLEAWCLIRKNTARSIRSRYGIFKAIHVAVVTRSRISINSLNSKEKIYIFNQTH